MLLPKTENYKLISVDIFDTLLLRTVAKPVDLFEQVWIEAERRGIAKISMYPVEFMKFRAEMERRARLKAKNREVNLDDIYKMFPDYIAFELEKLKDLEVELEKKVCYPNYIIVDWIREAKNNGCRVVLLSDMYLDYHTLADILLFNGIDRGLYENIIVSNMYQCSKQDGKLFDILIKKYFQISPKDMLHIGDNKNADYEQPLKKGMKAFYYDAIPDRLYSLYDYEKLRHNIPQPEILSLRKTCMSATAHIGDEKTAYEIGSAVTGPVLSLYASWVCRRLKELNIHKIYPLMREGYLLGELLKREAADIGFILEVHPIYVSRKVTCIPAIAVVNREEIENILGIRNLTLQESFELLGLQEKDFIELEEYYTTKYKEMHKQVYKGENLKEYVIQCFLRSENVRKITEHILEERKKLVSYLKQEIGDFEEIATIDIGFFGRIQMWMEKCLDLEQIPHKMKHFLAIGVTEERLFNGIDFEGMFGTFAENRDLITTIHRTPDVLEKLISVTEGSTIGYQRKGSEVIPIQAEGVDNDKVTEAAFQGVMAFQNIWFAFRKDKVEQADKCLKDRRGLLKILHRLIDMPTKCEAQMLAGLQADTNFGTAYRKGIITKEHLELAKEKGLDFIDKCNVSYTYKNSNITWPKGTVTLVDEFYYVRKALKRDAKNEIMKSMQEVVEQVQADGIKEIALYGAGENGRQFLFICRMYNIKVNLFIDRKKSIWGTCKEGVEVVGLDEAMKRGNDVYIVTSLFSISEIRDFILEKYKGSGKEKLRIYSV